MSALPRIFPRRGAGLFGDALTFCTTCAFSLACLTEAPDHRVLLDRHAPVEHVGPVRAGEHVFREGDPFTAVVLVRSGTVKTYRTGRDGQEQILGFYLPGEVIGLDAIHDDQYPCSAVALGTVMLCRFAYPRIAALATQAPKLQHRLFQLMSQEIGMAALFAADSSADERMAAFLVRLSRRYAALGFSPHRFQLTMPRVDIANYLRQAPETVSRVLRRFQQGGLVTIDQRDIELRDLPRLEALALPVLRH